MHVVDVAMIVYVFTMHLVGVAIQVVVAIVFVVAAMHVVARHYSAATFVVAAHAVPVTVQVGIAPFNATVEAVVNIGRLCVFLRDQGEL